MNVGEAKRRRKGRKAALLTAATLLTLLVLTGWFTRDHMRFLFLFEPLGNSDQGYPEYRHRQTGIVMVRVSGGTFMMGAQSDDPKAPNYDPHTQPAGEDVHEVTLSSFLIGKYEVTQAQWEAVMGSRPSMVFVRDNGPVDNVSWDELHAADGFLERTDLRLPTEAQWEYACRAGQEGPYSGTGRLDDMGWYAANSAGTLHPVGTKRPNQFGVYDMHGNVWEWCEDAVSLSGLAGRRLRGGCAGHNADVCRSAYRFWAIPDGRISAVGFRPAYWPLP